jgi:hypothetical protein
MSTRVIRTGVFPRQRPDGSPPAKHYSHYAAAEQYDAAGVRAVQGAVCPLTVSGGCDGRGPRADASFAFQNATGYAWTSQNYTEHWDTVHDALALQVYLHPSADGTAMNVEFVQAGGYTLIASVPGPSQYPLDGAFSLADGTITGSISSANNTLSMFHSVTGISVTSSVSGSAQTMSSATRAGGSIVNINIPPAIRAGLHCAAAHLGNSASLAAAYLAGSTTISAACGEGSNATDCQLVSLMIGSALAAYQEFLRSQTAQACGGAG